MKRQVFFSFHYYRDNWRASQIRNMGVVDDSSCFCDNEWEEVVRKSDDSIKKWIDEQMEKRSCLIVLIGSETASRKWVKYEIETALKKDKGILGIYIHKLKDKNQQQDIKGANPFAGIKHNGLEIDKYINVFDPKCDKSYNAYNDIKNNISSLIEEAVENRPSTWIK